MVHNDKEDLGIWLILVGLTVVLSPLKIAYDTFIIYSNAFFRDEWVLVSNLENKAHTPRIEQLLTGEIVVGIMFVVAWVFIALLFFYRKKSFPRWYISIWIATLIVTVVDVLATQAVLPDTPVLDPEHFSEHGYLGLSALVWIPYMLRSQRVKTTFVA